MPETSVPQELIGIAMADVGYSKTNEDGVCFGLCCMLLQYAARRKIKEFNELIIKIESLVHKYPNSQLKKAVDAAYNRRFAITKMARENLEKQFTASFQKAPMNVTEDKFRLFLKEYDEKHKTEHLTLYKKFLQERVELELTDEEKLIFQMLNLFDNIQLNMKPTEDEYRIIFNVNGSFNVQNFSLTFPLTKVDFPEEISLKKQLSFTDRVTKNHLAEYLAVLETNLNSYDLKAPVTFLANSNFHTLTLIYDPLTKKWSVGGTEYIPVQEELSVAAATELLFTSFTNYDESITNMNLNFQMFVEADTALKLENLEETLAKNTKWRRLRNGMPKRYTKHNADENDVLLCAILEHDNVTVKRLVPNKRKGLDTEFGELTYLRGAIEAGNMEALSCLLSNKYITVNYKNADGTTALHYACSRLEEEAVRLLLARNADVNSRENHGLTPLMHAALDYASDKIITLLIQNGALIDATDNKGNTALIYACLEGNKVAVDCLLKHGADVAFSNKGIDALQAAIKAKNSSIILTLLDKFESEQKVYQLQPLQYLQLIHHGLIRKEPELINRVVAYGADFKNIETKYMPLLFKCILKDPSTLPSVLQQNLSPNFASKKGNTLLHIFITRQSEFEIDLLLAHGANPHAMNNKNDTPLTLAIKSGDKNLFKKLFTSCKTNKKELALLLKTAIIEDNSKVLRYLIKNRDCVEFKIDGETPLQMATRLGMTDIQKIKKEIKDQQIIASLTQFGRKRPNNDSITDENFPRNTRMKS